MSKTIENQTKHLGMMGSAVKTLDKILSINRLQTFLEAVSLSRLKDISDGIESISSTGRNLTTELESTFQSNSRSMAAFGVNIGKTGADLKKFKKETSAAAYATGISIDEMGKAFYGFEPAGEILKSLGIEGGEAFAKFAEVTHVDAQKFGWDLGQMQKETGLTTEQMNLLVSQAAKMGKTTGDVGKALNDLPEMAELFNARKALGDSPEAITSFGQQIFGLGDALYGVGIKTGPDFAKHLAKTMTESKKSFKDLFAGTGEDLSAFQSELMVTGLAPGKVFAAMEQGPAEFMKVMAEQVTQLEANGGDVGKALEFMRGRMSQTFGGEQTALLVNALKDPVKRGGIAAIETMSKTTKVLGDIQKEGYEGRFTLAEQFERSEAMMVHRFRQIGREGAKGFVKSTTHEFGLFGDVVTKISADGGAMGSFVKKLSLAHQIGAQAFIPETLRPMVTLFGSVAKEMAPMLGMLGSLGFRFTMLLNPLTLVAGALAAVGGMFAYSWLEAKKVESLTVGKNFDKAKNALAGFRAEQKKAKKGSEEWLNLQTMIGKQEQMLADASLLRAAEATGDAEKIAQAKAELQIKTFERTLTGVGDTLVGFFDALPGYIDTGVKAFENFFSGTGSSSKVVDLFTRVFESMGKAFSKIGQILGPFVEKYGPLLMQMLSDAIKKYYPVVLTALLDAVGWALSALWEVLPGLVMGGLKLLSDVVLMAWDAIREYFVEKFPESAGDINTLFNVVAATFQAISTVVQWVTGVIFDGWKALFSFFEDRMHSTTSIWEDTWTGIKALFSEWYMGIYYDFVNLWTDIKKLASEGWEGLKTILSTAADWWSKLFLGIVDSVTAPFVAIWDWVDKLFMHSVSTWIQEDLDVALKFVENFGKLAGQAFDMVTSGLNALLPSSMQVGGGSDTKPVPPAAKPSPALGADARDAALIAAVHQPAWYARYEQVFASRMDALIRTVGGAGAPAPGGKRPSGNRLGKTEAAGSNMGLYRNMGVDLTGGG